MRTRKRGGYKNDTRLPIVGDTVIIENDRYNITAIEGDRVIVNGESYDPNDLTLDTDLSGSFDSVPNSPTTSAFGNVSPIGSPGSFSFSENDSMNELASPQGSDMTSLDGQSASEYSGSIGLQLRGSEDSDQTTKPTVSFFGGKRRKSKRRTKRKLKWDNKATVAVVATTMAFDKTTMPPTDLPEPAGGKKTKRKSNTRKKPRSLKKRVR